MRITDALKPVTDALTANGLSLDSVTYKDGKIHATLNEVPKVTGKTGSGPEFPPEGYRLARVSEDLTQEWNLRTWDYTLGGWIPCTVQTRYFWGSLAIAVPIYPAPRIHITPKPEPVELTAQEKMVGWRGPSGFRLQTFQKREVKCVVCGRAIKAGSRLARWRHKFPEGQDLDQLCGKPGNEESHSHAHVDCLYHTMTCQYPGLSYHVDDVPQWLREKRKSPTNRIRPLDK